MLDERMTSASDQDLAAACAREGRGLVTLDLDFANPLRFPPGTHAGIAVLRLPARPTPADLQACIETLSRALLARSFEGELWIVERERIREYDGR